MKAIQVSRTGGPEVLTYTDLPVPKPKPNEAVVQIKAAGVNFIDIYIREGRYPANLPFIPGQEGAGVVTEVGNEVKRFAPGARVAYTNIPGSYTEYAVVPAERLVAIPDGLDFNDGAALMLQGMTAHYLTKSSYPLKPGDTCLIHAAAGGMGLLLVQIAKMLGARTIGTAGTEEKAELARKAGADDVIVYTRQDFVAEVKRLTGGAGVNVVYDGVGKDTFEGDLQVLKPRGYLVLFGASSGAVPPFDLIRLMTAGSLFVTRPTLTHHIVTREELEWRANDIFEWVKNKKLRVTIGKTYPLKEAAQAHRDLEGRRTTGKLLLIP
jgi:NADPH2:quinone reductase